MTRYFMKFTPLFAAEVQMMTPPRHQPRRSGRIRSSFRYSADDVRCKDCTRYDSGHPCHLNECVCLEERIEAGVVELNALARECFGGRLFRPLQRRLRDELNRQPFCFFLSDAHRERWTHWKNRCYGKMCIRDSISTVSMVSSRVWAVAMRPPSPAVSAKKS